MADSVHHHGYITRKNDYLRRLRRIEVTPREEAMSTVQTYTVTGMTCSHCVASVTEEVQEIPAVEHVDVVLETGRLTVTSVGPIEDTAVKTAVQDAGYRLA